VTLGRKVDMNPGGARNPATTCIARLHCATTSVILSWAVSFCKSATKPVVSWRLKLEPKDPDSREVVMAKTWSAEVLQPRIA
jgi:hypothetical protein